MPFSIARPEDIPAISILVNRAYRGDSSRKGWTTEADILDGTRTNEETLLKELSDTATSLIIYKEESRLTGAVNLKKEGDSLYLGMLTVSPEAQGQGIGKKLVKAAEEYGRTHNCLKLKLTVITVRSELIAWYQKLGFQITPERLPFEFEEQFGIPRLRLELLVMEKLL